MSLVTRVIADALAEGYGMAKDEVVERVAARRRPAQPVGTAGDGRPRPSMRRDPRAEEAAEIAATHGLRARRPGGGRPESPRSIERHRRAETPDAPTADAPAAPARRPSRRDPAGAETEQPQASSQE